MTTGVKTLSRYGLGDGRRGLGRPTQAPLNRHKTLDHHQQTIPAASLRSQAGEPGPRDYRKPHWVPARRCAAAGMTEVGGACLTN